MAEEKVSETHLTSAAAFVEGGIQDACDDACSICLEAFCESDPSTVTGCKHEFHLQCILEWCQRSSQCPMCWQAISLKDPSSQELLDAVEHERNVRMNPPRNTTIFHHPTLGDFELQHLPINASDPELEERIIQHLAAAAAMGRARQIARREGQRSRSSTQGRPHFLVFSTPENSPPATSASGSPTQRPNSPLITVGEDSTLRITHQSSPQADQVTTTASGSSSGNRRSPAQATPNSQDRAGPSDFQSISETVKSRLSSWSSRYKESITKSTRGWKERLFARNSSSPEPAAEVRREVDPGMATVSRMMDHLEIAQDSRSSSASVASNSEDIAAQVPAEGQMTRAGGSSPLTEDNRGAPVAAGSASN